MSLVLVKDLRDKTGAGLLDCQKAVKEAEGDGERALRILREKGLAKAANKASRAATDGIVGSYIHPGSKIGVLVEVNCETDFVAMTEEFQRLVRDVAMQIAATAPRCVRREEIDPAEIEAEQAIYRAQAEKAGKPAKIIDRIVAGQLERYYQDVCLLEQAFVKQSDRTVGDILKEAIVRFGVNVEVRRFARFQLGETASSPGNQKEQDAGGDAGS